MSSADIILVKPGSQKQLYGELSAFNLTAIEPPVWAALLAAYLRNLGYSVVLIDAEVENLSYEQTAERIKDAKPRLAGIVRIRSGLGALTAALPALKSDKS